MNGACDDLQGYVFFISRVNIDIYQNQILQFEFFSCKAELQTWTKNSERYLERYKILDWFWIALLLDLWLCISVALLCLCYWFSKQIISARGLLVFQAIWLTIMPTQKLSNESFFDKCLSIDLIEHAKRITNNNTHRETRA